MAKSKVKTEKTETAKVPKRAEESSPQAKRGRPENSPKAKEESVKKTPMKAKADDAKKSTHPPTSKMVAQAFTVLKNRKGNSLAAIRNHIAKTFDCTVNKTIQFHIKKYIKDEFEAGRIKIVGSENEDDEIKFNSSRFALVK